MTDHAWRTAWGRWGDQLWSLALVRWGKRPAAQQALVRAFERVYAAGTPPADAHTALLQALLQPRRRVLFFARQRDLPHLLRRIPPLERALFALWLVQDGKGDQLAKVSGWAHHTLVQRLATALLPFLPRNDPARRTRNGWEALTQWLTQQLNLSSIPLPDAIGETTTASWQQALHRVHDLLVSTIGRQRAPSTVRDAIEAALTARDDDTPAWQQWTGWLALAVLLGIGVWILRPPAAAQSASSTVTPPAPINARSVVENALETWTATPVSSTLHRRVWAIEPSIGEAPALVTDVWLGANSARYRVETTHDGRLVEWQLGDGSGELQYAARSNFSPCRWGDAPSTRATLVFDAGAAQQQAVRDSRLQQGAYGRGYQMLQTALGAPDLRSWGTRTENDVPVLLLGYNDPSLPNRQRVLVFDGRTQRLQAVRELAGDGAQAVARDLWRVEQEEVVPGDVSITPPSRPQARLARRTIFDPACLDLDKDHLLSLRALVGSDTGWWLPVRLPPDVEAAALVSNDIVTPQIVSTWQFQSPNGRAVFVGGERSLRIGVQQTFVNLDGSVERGPWRVVFTHDQRNIRAQLCKPLDPLHRACPPDVRSLVIEAQGWTEAQILDLIDNLAPVSTPSTWLALDTLFVDPQPLDPQVQQVLARTLERANVVEGVIHSTAEITHTPGVEQGDVVVDLFGDTTLSDPYAVPRQWIQPEQFSVQQTVVMSGGLVQQARATTNVPDGTLLYARVMNDVGMVSYSAMEQAVSTNMAHEQIWLRQALQAQSTHVFKRAQVFASSMLPITLRDAGDAWVLQQPTFEPNPYRLDMYMRRFGPYMQHTASGSYMERLWIDKHTGLLRRAEVVQVNEEGGETMVSALQVRAWQVEPLATATELPMPPLPPDTLAYTYDNFGPTVTSDLQPFMPPQHEWVWRDEFDIVNHSDRNRLFEGVGTPDDQQQRQMFAASMLSPSMDQLQAVGLIHSTVYRVPNSRTSIVVRQGAAPLVRYALRFASLGYDGSPGWTQSRAVRVFIGGEERTAWLLESYVETALVVEIDGIIMHISSLDKAYIDGALLDALPQLERMDVAQWKGTP
jgi:hypothetical protein